jgi:hypothetical protein
MSGFAPRDAASGLGAVRQRTASRDGGEIASRVPNAWCASIYRVMSRARGDSPPAAEPAPSEEHDPQLAPAATPLYILVAGDNEFSAPFLGRLHKYHQILEES